jgi:MEMO1 family protein
MKKHGIFIVVIVFCLIGLFLVFTSRHNAIPTGKVHPLLFSDQEAFTKAITGAHAFTTIPLKGGIIPHHLVASDNIANFFRTLNSLNIKTIVLIGPNHYEKGDFDALTSNIGWDSPYGVVESDTQVIDELVIKNLAHIDDDTIEHDHSVASFTPFFRHFIPGTKIVPIILKRGFSVADAEILSDYLSQLPSDTFFIASVDFSHYLPKDIAYEKDIITEELLTKKNYSGLYQLNNDFIDSPSSIILLLKTMEKIKANNMEIFAHTNSANYPNSDQKNTTSHYVVGFY